MCLWGAHAQSDYFDSSSHWLTEDQRAKAERAEKEFLARLDKRRGGQPVTFSIDIAGRRSVLSSRTGQTTTDRQIDLWRDK